MSISTTEHLRAGDERLYYHSSANQTVRYAGHQAVSSEADYDDLPTFGPLTGHLTDILEGSVVSPIRDPAKPDGLQSLIDEANARTRVHIIS